MKIAYFNYMADLYGYSIGSTVKAKRLLGDLERFGHTVKFHWLSAQKNLSHGAEATPVRFRRLRPILLTPKQLMRNLPQFLREFLLLLRDRPDLLIVRLDAFRISALWAARLLRIPMFVEADGACSYEWLTFHRSGLWPKALLWCEKIMLNAAVGVFTQSSVAKEYYLRRHGLSSDKIEVITNGADPVTPLSAQEITEMRRHLGLEQAQPIIGFVGSMHHWHGVDQMASLVDNVLREFPGAAFLFVGGGGALEETLKKQLGELQKGRVVFTDTVPYDRVNRYIQLFNIAVAPYPHIDVFYFSPVKMFEYAAAGKAIVAAAIGQIAEIFRDGEQALLYEPGDVQDFQRQLYRLIKDPSLRRKIGAEAQKLILAEHTWRHKAAHLHHYITRLLRKK